MIYSAAQKSAMDRDNRQMALEGLSMSSVLQSIEDDISSGNIGITAAAGDVDALALDGGHFAQDKDLTTALTFAYKAGRLHNGLTVVSAIAGTLLLNASATNYVEVDRAGTVSSNTSGFTTGSMPLYLITTGISTIATVTNKKSLLTLIGPGGVTGTLLSSTAKIKSDQIYIGTISGTTSFLFVAPHACTVLGVSVASSTAVATSDTNYWTASALNKGPGGAGTTALLATTNPLNTTKASGGASVVAFVNREFTLHGTPANLELAAGDVCVVTFTETGTADELTDAVIRVKYSSNN